MPIRPTKRSQKNYGYQMQGAQPRTPYARPAPPSAPQAPQPQRPLSPWSTPGPARAQPAPPPPRSPQMPQQGGGALPNLPRAPQQPQQPQNPWTWLPPGMYPGGAIQQPGLPEIPMGEPPPQRPQLYQPRLRGPGPGPPHPGAAPPMNRGEQSPGNPYTAMVQRLRASLGPGMPPDVYNQLRSLMDAERNWSQQQQAQRQQMAIGQFYGGLGNQRRQFEDQPFAAPAPYGVY